MRTSINCILLFIGFTFKELALIQASASKVNCCHFSLDGKLLATGGHDKKVCASWRRLFHLEI